MKQIKSLSAETDKKILNKEKEIQKLDEKKQKLRNEITELKKQQLRERNDGFGDLLKKNNIDTNEMAQLLRSNSEALDMIRLFLSEQKPNKQEEVQLDAEAEEDAEQEEQAVTGEEDEAEESYEEETDDEETESYDSYDDSDDDYIDFNS